MAPINESNPPENRDTAVMSSKHLLCSYGWNRYCSHKATIPEISGQE